MKTDMVSHSPTQRIATILAVSALALGLSACSKNEDVAAGQRLDSAAQRSEQAAVDARTSTESTVQNAQTNMEQGAARATASAHEAVDSAKVTVDDAAITAKVNASLARDPDLSALKINVDTVDGKVTLDGPAPTTVARDRAETLVKAIEGVTGVNNQLVVTAS